MFETARPFLLAIAIGLLIGIERERAHADQRVKDPLGSRTFTLLALLGAVAAYVPSEMFSLALTAFAGVIIVAGYLRTPLEPEGSGVGVTTEVAAMVTFALGYMARFDAELTIMLAVVALVVLALKPRIHSFAKAGLSQKEVSAALTFLVIAFVVLPLLPDRPLDPWGLFNPFRLWLLFVLINGVSFAGYVAVKLLGDERGLALAGLFGGFVSSTATTLSLSQKYRDQPGFAGPLAIGIVLANAASAAAQILVVAVANPSMLPEIGWVIGAAVVAGLLGSAAAAWITSAQGAAGTATTLTLTSPIALRPSLMFAAGFGILLALSAAAARLFGPAGVVITAAIGGATDVHAATLAVATMAGAGSLAPRQAVFAVLVGFAANMAVKLTLVAWAGGKSLFLLVAPPLAAMVATAVFFYFIV